MFKDTIKALRKERGLTQTELAEVVGFTHVAVVKWENGQREPDFSTLIKLADYFGVSVDYLLGREDKFSLPKLNAYMETIPAPSIKAAVARKRNETVDMLMYRYQNVIDEEYFWLLIELCSHIERKDGLELFATLCNAMIEKGYPAIEYYVEAYRYFVDGQDKPIVWNESCPTLTAEQEAAVVESVAKSVSDKFAKDYAALLDDDSFRKTAKLYQTITPEQRKVIVGIIAAYFIDTLHKDTFPIIGR